MSVLLKSDNGAEFELALIEDRFPEIQDDANDSTYLTLSFRVATGDESWEETAPIVNIFELKNLHEWLSAVGDGSPEVPELELLEPELRFSIATDSGDKVTIRIGFHIPDRPEQYTVDHDTTEADHVDIRISRSKVRTAAAELDRDLQAAAALPPAAQSDEDQSGLAGIPDEGLNLIDPNLPFDETDEDIKF